MDLKIAALIIRELGKPRSLMKFVKDNLGRDLEYSLDTKKVNDWD